MRTVYQPSPWVPFAAEINVAPHAVWHYRLAIQADGGMPLDDAAGAVTILGARHHVPHHCHLLALQQIVGLGRHHLATMSGAIT